MRSRILFLLTILVSFVLLCSCRAGDSEMPDSYTEGLFLLARNGSPMIVLEDGSGCPCTMEAAVEGIGFGGLTDGDRIRIRCSEIMDSWPGQVRIYGVEKLSDGEKTDISPVVLSQLTESGWLGIEPSCTEDAE